MTDEIIDAEAGRGATTVAVGAEHGKVVLKFPREIEWCVLDPQVAPLVAEAMIKAAGQCGVQVMLQVPKARVTDKQREKMQQQAVLVIKNLRDRGRSDAYIACELVDLTLRDLL